MQSSPNSSFIPKRNPAKRTKVNKTQKVYFFTIVSYVLLFAALLSAGGSFLYKTYLDKQKTDSVSALYKAINSFDENKMQEVLAFEKRLKQAKGRVDANVSINSLFLSIEDSTIKTVQIEQFELNRQMDEHYLMSAEIGTDSFDSTIFQRGMYRQNEAVEGIDITEVNASINRSQERSRETQRASVTTGVESSVLDSTAPVAFVAEIIIPVSSILYTGLETIDIATDEQNEVQEFVSAEDVNEEENDSDVDNN